MTMPTDSQIEAAVALPTYQVELFQSGSGWVDVSSHVVSVEGEARANAGDDGISFGVVMANSQRIQVAKEAFSYTWDRSPVRVKFGFGGTNPLHFIGLIDGLEQRRVDATWQARGYQALLEAAEEIRSPLLYRRPVFTQTSTVSVEDPDDSSWRGGLGNLILWRAGGRPWAQAGAYPSAPFYYNCETSILAPEWSWINGGNALKALQDLCAAAGGVLYQRTDGVIAYAEPFGFAAPAQTFHYTDSALAADASYRVANNVGQYGGISRSIRTRELVVDIVRANFVKRRLQGVREIYSDTTPLQIEPGETTDPIPLDLQLPCYRLDRVEVKAGTLHTAQVVTPVQLTVTIVKRYAQRVEITLHNTLTERVAVYAIKAFGQPLVAGEAGSASYGSAPVGITYPRSYALPDSHLVQSRTYAERLCQMYHDFYAAARPIVHLTGCGYDPRRFLGEIVGLTSADWGLSNEPHRIVGIRVSRTGVQMDLDLVPIAGLPTSSQFWQIGGVYGDSDQRMWAY